MNFAKQIEANGIMLNFSEKWEYMIEVEAPLDYIQADKSMYQFLKWQK